MFFLGGRVYMNIILLYVSFFLCVCASYFSMSVKFFVNATVFLVNVRFFSECECCFLCVARALLCMQVLFFFEGGGPCEREIFFVLANIWTSSRSSPLEWTCERCHPRIPSASTLLPGSKRAPRRGKESWSTSPVRHIKHIQYVATSQCRSLSCFVQPSQKRRSLWWRRGRRWSMRPAEIKSFSHWGRRSLRWCWSCSGSGGTRSKWWLSSFRTPAPRLHCGRDNVGCKNYMFSLATTLGTTCVVECRSGQTFLLKSCNALQTIPINIATKTVNYWQ